MVGLQTVFCDITIHDEKDLPLREFISDIHIKEISIAHKAKKMGSANISLVNLSLDQVETGAIEEGKVLSIAWGVVGEWQLSRRYLVKEIKYKYGAQIDAVVELRDYKTKMFDRKAGKVWTKKTASEIARDIAGKFKLSTKHIQDTTTKYTIVQGHRSYSAVLYEIAYLEGAYWDVNEESIVFRPLYEADTTKGMRTWWVHGPNRLPDIIDFEIVSTARHIGTAAASKKKSGTAHADQDGNINPGDDTEAMEKGIAGVKTVALDLFGGEATKAEATAEDTPAIGEGNIHLDITYKDDGSFTEKEVSGEVDSHPANEDPAVAKKRAEAAVLDAKFKTHKASMVIRNQPVQPHEVFDIRGVAHTHAGMYKVMELSIKIAQGVITNQISIVRDTANKKGTKPKETSPQDSSSPSDSDEADTVVVEYQGDGTFNEL